MKIKQNTIPIIRTQQQKQLLMAQILIVYFNQPISSWTIDSVI